MSDLTDELLHMAADGADRARPLAVAEVMRRGNRRRARAIGQRSLTGLSVLGVGAAVVATGVLHPAHGPAGNAAAGTSAHGTTVTETTQSSAGTLTVKVTYRDAARDKIKPLSISFAGKSKVTRHASVVFSFEPTFCGGQPEGSGCTSAWVPEFVITARVNKAGGFAVSLSRRTIADIIRANRLRGDQVMTVSLAKVNSATVITAGLVLNR